MNKTNKSKIDLTNIAKKVSLDVDTMLTITRNYATAKKMETDMVLDELSSGKLTVKDHIIQIPSPVQETESDPLSFLDIIHGESNSRNATKSKGENLPLKSINTSGMQSAYFLHLAGNKDGQLGTFDQTTIVRSSGEILGHAMVIMGRIKKYYCTHCLGTIDAYMADQHVQKCFFEIGSGVPQFYCSCCNARCGSRENYIVHVNSPAHSSRIAFLKELVKKKNFYVDNDGVSYVLNSNTAKNADKHIISTENLLYRINSTVEISQPYMLTDGQKLFKLMASLIITKEKSSDEIGTTLVQRNAILKAFNMYRAEVNMGFVLCYPQSTSDDFICVSNCAAALKELNYDVVNNSTADENTKAIRRLKIDEIFQTKDVPNGSAGSRMMDCRICGKTHAMKKYINPQAIDKTITMTLSKLI